MKLLPLIALFVVFAFTPAKAVDYLFLEHTITGKTFGIIGDPNAQYTYVVSQNSGTGTTQFALTSNGTFASTQQLTFTTNDSGLGTIPYYVKGTTVGTSNIRFCGLDGMGCIGPDAWEVVTISTLEYQVINSAIDTNPNTSGGSRIYPDKQNPSDNINRKLVRVRATLSSVTASGIDVFFKSFDVDDPSSSASPVDPDTGGAGSGDDNRASINKLGLLSEVGVGGASNTTTVTSNGSGVAEADFQVTMHPGDNFKIAASGDPNALGDIRVDGVNLEDSSNNALPLTKVKGTPMLTVWRKIHLEVDNMGDLGTNHESGTIPTAVHSSGQTVMDISPAIETGRYVPGRININGKAYTVHSNTANQVVVNEQITLNKVIGKSFTIYDDDDYDGDNAWRGDENETTIGSLNAFAKMQTSNSASSNVFAPAYIMPTYNGGGGANNGTSTGYVNIEDGDVESRLNAARGSTGNGSNDFWVSYIQVAYQGKKAKDSDPNSADTTLGVTPGLTGDSASADCSGLFQGGTGSLIFQEPLRDVFAFAGQANDDLTAPHELGHQFGLKGDSAGTNWGIMGEYNVGTFVPAHVHMLRCRVNSPGL